MGVDVFASAMPLNEVGAHLRAYCLPELMTALTVRPQLAGIGVNDIHEVVNYDLNAGARSAHGFLHHPKCRLSTKYVESKPFVRHNESQNPSVIQKAMNIAKPANKVRHVLNDVARYHIVEFSVSIGFGQAHSRKVKINRAYVAAGNVRIPGIFRA